MQSLKTKRAAIFVALLICSGGLLFMPVRSFLLPRVEARMPVERLAIELKSGRGLRHFQVEVADTDQAKAVGLMFRSSLADDRGMLFHYGRTQVITMWMRNTYIPLDMLFLKADGRIDSIHPMAEPLSEDIISSEGRVAAVLELAGGAAARLGIAAGDRVLHPLFGAGTPRP